MKPKPITLCCVLTKKYPKLSFLNLIRPSDAKYVTLAKGEKIIPVIVQAK